MEEIKSLLAVSDTPPEEAAQNILGAQEYDITPESYKDLREPLMAQSELDALPENAPPVVTQMALKSTQHASLIKRDVAALSEVENYMDMTANIRKGKDLSRRRADILSKKVFGVELTDDEELEARDLGAELSALKKPEQYGYGYWGSFAPEVLATVEDSAKGVWNGKDILGIGAAAGAGWGALRALPSGPAGMAISAGFGALKGAGTALFPVRAMDTLRQSAGNIYAELETAVPGDSQLAENTRRNLAKGSGVLMALVELPTTWVFINKIPVLQKALAPARYLKELLKPNSKLGKTVMAIGSAGLAEGIEEGGQEVIQIITEEIGKTFNGTETSFLQGLSNAAQKWGDNATRVGKAALLGAGAGGTTVAVGQGISKIAGVGGKPSEAAMKEAKITPPTPPAPVEPPKPSDVRKTPDTSLSARVTRAVSLKALMDQTVAKTKDTDINKLAPQEMDEFRKNSFDKAGITEVFADKEDLNAWANNEKKSADLFDAMEETATGEADLNAPIRFQPHKWLRLVEKYPELSNLVKADPEGMTVQAWVNKLAEAKKQREQVEATVPKDGKPIQIPESRIKDEEIFGEEDYLEQPTTTQAMDKVLPPEVVFRINESQAKTRVEVADAINEEVEAEIEKITDVETEMNLLLEREFQESEIQTPENVDLVDEFLNPATRDPKLFTPAQVELNSRGKPLHAINPESLDSRQKGRYLDDQVLKERGVFQKKGMHISEVAAIYGKSPDDLLKILAETPTRQQMIDNAVEAQRASVAEQTRNSNKEIRESRLAKAYNDMTRNHLKELKILRERYWSGLKTGIKTIANPMPTFEGLAERARVAVGNMQLKNLKPNQWKVAERRSQRKAVDLILKNQIEAAFKEKENAAEANQLTKETYLAIKKANRMIKWIANLNSKEMRAELGFAGKIYEDAVNFILDVYNFDPTQKGQTRVESYNKFVNKMLAEGKGNFEIPPEVQAWLTTKTSAKELTIDQLTFLHDHLKRIVNQARLKNRLLDNNEQRTQEMLVEIITDHLESHPAYDDSRSDEKQGLKKLSHEIGLGVYSLEDLLKNTQAILQQADAGVIGGPMWRIIGERLAGVGAYKGQYGQTANINMLAEIKDRLKKHIKNYGEGFRDLGIKKVNIPEFGKGVQLEPNQTKLDLLRILMNMGTESNQDYVENFGISRDDMMRVLQRELSQKDFDFVQNAVWDEFARLKPKIAALEKQTTGLDIEFIEPKSFEAFGKTYKGGYFPVQLKYDSTDSIAQKYQDFMDNIGVGEKLVPPPSTAFEGIVKSPHTKERKGSGKVLDLKVDGMLKGFDQVVWDLTMRIPVRDSMTLLNDKSVEKALKASLGAKRYKMLYNQVAALTHSVSANNRQLYSDSVNSLSRFIDFVGSAFLINKMFGSTSTVMINTLAISTVLQKMGPSGAKHLSAAFTRLGNPLNWTKYGKIAELAAEKDSTILSHRSGLDDQMSSAMYKLLPKKRLFNNKPYQLLKTGVEGMQDLFFNGILGKIDTFTKIAVIEAAERQFLAGDAPGHPLSEISKMSEQELREAAASYAAHLSEATTQRAKPSDKAAIQQITFLKEIARVWNESRNVANNKLQEFRNIHYSNERMIKYAKEGDFLAANIAHDDAGNRLLWLITLSAASLVLKDVVRRDKPWEKGDEEQDLEEMFTSFEGLTRLGLEVSGVSEIPGVRDLVYGINKNIVPSLPVVQGLYDIGSTATFGVVALAEELGFIDAANELDEFQWNQVFNSAGIALGGLPINGFRKLKLLTDDFENIPELPGIEIIGAAIGYINQFIEKYDSKKEEDMTDDELLEKRSREMDEREAALPGDDMQQVVEQAKVARDQMAPPAVTIDLDAEQYEIIKYAESGGKWNAQPPGASLDDAFGIYQFLESTWDNVIKLPEARAAGLRKEHRLAKNTKWQELGMRILTKDNIKQLQRKKVPVSLESVYFAHHFGPARADDVYLKPDKTKINPATFFNKYEVRDNPAIKNIRTVADFKQYIRSALKRGADTYQEKTGREISLN